MLMRHMCVQRITLPIGTAKIRSEPEKLIIQSYGVLDRLANVAPIELVCGNFR